MKRKNSTISNGRKTKKKKTRRRIVISKQRGGAPIDVDVNSPPDVKNSNFNNLGSSILAIISSIVRLPGKIIRNIFYKFLDFLEFALCGNLYDDLMTAGPIRMIIFMLGCIILKLGLIAIIVFLISSISGWALSSFGISVPLLKTTSATMLKYGSFSGSFIYDKLGLFFKWFISSALPGFWKFGAASIKWIGGAFKTISQLGIWGSLWYNFVHYVLLLAKSVGGFMGVSTVIYLIDKIPGINLITRTLWLISIGLMWPGGKLLEWAKDTPWFINFPLKLSGGLLLVIPTIIGGWLTTIITSGKQSFSLGGGEKSNFSDKDMKYGINCGIFSVLLNLYSVIQKNNERIMNANDIKDIIKKSETSKKISGGGGYKGITGINNQDDLIERLTKLLDYDCNKDNLSKLVNNMKEKIRIFLKEHNKEKTGGYSIKRTRRKNKRRNNMKRTKKKGGGKKIRSIMRFASRKSKKLRKLFSSCENFQEEYSDIYMQYELLKQKGKIDRDDLKSFESLFDKLNVINKSLILELKYSDMNDFNLVLSDSFKKNEEDILERCFSELEEKYSNKTKIQNIAAELELGELRIKTITNASWLPNKCSDSKKETSDITDYNLRDFYDELYTNRDIEGIKYVSHCIMMGSLIPPDGDHESFHIYKLCNFSPVGFENVPTQKDWTEITKKLEELKREDKHEDRIAHRKRMCGIIWFIKFFIKIENIGKTEYVPFKNCIPPGILSFS